MKKILTLIISIFMFFIGTTKVWASSFSTSISGDSEISLGEQFDITIAVNTDYDLMAMSAILNYDTSKLTYVSASGKNGFAVTVGNKIILDSVSGKSGKYNIVTLTFKATSLFVAGTSTTISIGSILGTDGEIEFSGNSSSKKISIPVPKSSNSKLSDLKINGSTISGFKSGTTTYNFGSTDKDKVIIGATVADSKSTVSGVGTKKLNYGKNTLKIVVTAENGKKTTYSVIITRNDNRSTNNYLSSLSVSGTNLKFNKNTTKYTIVVDNKVDSINIGAVPEDSKSTVSGTGTKKLKVYLNTFKVVVTAENKVTRTYQINISRKDESGNIGALSKNNKLSSLIVEGHNISFDADVTNYSLSVDNIVDKVTVKASAADENATVEIKNLKTLVVGENEISVIVTSQSGEQKIYTIIINRKSDSPVVSISDLKKTIEKTTTDIIEVEINDNNNEISKEVMSLLFQKEKGLNINKYENNTLLYSWFINGNKDTEGFKFNTLISFSSDNKDIIDNLANYADVKYLSFANDEKLPNNTMVKIYVGDKFVNEDEINLYYYDENNNKLILQQEKLLVKNGYIEFKTSDYQDYIVTKSKIDYEKDSNNDIIFIVMLYIIIVETLIIVVKFFSYLIFDKKIINFKRKDKNIIK